MLISREIALSVVNKDRKGQIVLTTVLSAGIVAKEVILEQIVTCGRKYKRKDSRTTKTRWLM